MNHRENRTTHRHKSLRLVQAKPTRAILASLSLRAMQRDAELLKSQDETGVKDALANRTYLLTKVGGRFSHRNLPGSCISVLQKEEMQFKDSFYDRLYRRPHADQEKFPAIGAHCMSHGLALDQAMTNTRSLLRSLVGNHKGCRTHS